MIKIVINVNLSIIEHANTNADNSFSSQQMMLIYVI